MEKERLITVKGIGELRVPVDFVEMNFTLSEKNKDYKKGYENFQKGIEEIQSIISNCGFDKKELKTSELKTITEYDHISKKGAYTEVFRDYNFIIKMKLCFDFTGKKLGELYAYLSKSKAVPKIDVDFTVKDKESVKKQLLGNAARDAKDKAEILCQSMNAKLGQLVKINYNWEEVHIYSKSIFEAGDDDMFVGCSPSFVSTGGIDYTPDDIDVSDNALFVWEIID